MGNAAGAFGLSALSSRQRHGTPTANKEYLQLIRVYLARQRYTKALEQFSAYLDWPGDIERSSSWR